ncbi:hypothetical protein BDZ89DRAFT_1147104 [Hymenopellis radicata]|nr:hypothetical protein BDZ89DRAFT_1147104 [Hymenopellis radicata]
MALHKPVVERVSLQRGAAATLLYNGTGFQTLASWQLGIRLGSVADVRRRTVRISALFLFTLFELRYTDSETHPHSPSNCRSFMPSTHLIKALSQQLPNERCQVGQEDSPPPQLPAQRQFILTGGADKPRSIASLGKRQTPSALSRWQLSRWPSKREVAFACDQVRTSHGETPPLVRQLWRANPGCGILLSLLTLIKTESTAKPNIQLHVFLLLPARVIHCPQQAFIANARSPSSSTSLENEHSSFSNATSNSYHSILCSSAARGARLPTIPQRGLAASSLKEDDELTMLMSDDVSTDGGADDDERDLTG